MISLKDLFKKEANEALQNIQAILDNPKMLESFEQAANMIAQSLKAGGTLYVAGNGGSAADAQHMVAELVVKLNKNRDPLRAVALTVDTSIITAAGNDFSYDDIFSRQVEALAKPNDVFLGITTSGNSKNILNCFAICKKIGAKSICLTGKDGGKAVKENMADLNVVMNGPNTARIQEGHAIWYHTMCYALEVMLVESGTIRYR
ncbi:SIS domain-containing protein [Pseudobdellovibrio sp. HCB154]|uniref:D-sedoheptulose-7-phosphate isomerase n=1 Tax=Pseudobdellovibrio sp. HCB154 TaxID=3386277 RepID=UPI00391723FF